MFGTLGFQTRDFVPEPSGFSLCIWQCTLDKSQSNNLQSHDLIAKPAHTMIEHYYFSFIPIIHLLKYFTPTRI